MSDGIKYDGSNKRIIFTSNGQETITISGSSVGVSGTLLINGASAQATLQSAYQNDNNVFLVTNKPILIQDTNGATATGFAVRTNSEINLFSNLTMSIGSQPEQGFPTPIIIGRTDYKGGGESCSAIGYKLVPDTGFTIDTWGYGNVVSYDTVNDLRLGRSSAAAGVTWEKEIIGIAGGGSNDSTTPIFTVHGTIVEALFAEAPSGQPKAGVPVYLSDQVSGTVSFTAPTDPGTYVIKVGITINSGDIGPNGGYYILYNPQFILQNPI